VAGLAPGAAVRDPELRKDGRSPRELMLLPAAPLESPPFLAVSAGGAESFLSRALFSSLHTESTTAGGN
jgi:hypothetical protein